MNNLGFEPVSFIILLSSRTLLHCSYWELLTDLNFFNNATRYFTQRGLFIPADHSILYCCKRLGYPGDFGYPRDGGIYI